MLTLVYLLLAVTDGQLLLKQLLANYHISLKEALKFLKLYLMQNFISYFLLKCNFYYILL